MRPSFNLYTIELYAILIHETLIILGFCRQFAGQSAYIWHIHDAVFSVDCQDRRWMRIRRESC